MSIRTLSRCGVAIFAAALIAGCSSSGSKTSDQAAAKSYSSAARSGGECASRSKCIYKGAYESGERNYAEAEAKRLNMAELERLRRAFGN
ncbi:hypothetical protein IB268_18290 [Achromobacter sp. ACM01]|uniref:hypothetical protein n=1 Tax=Achromobacter sp. ACM01 TaxID=2769298 RepID=UPI0017877686|nr:hypothetical protein [Achromobacter sp. ACM01]MBD9474877.1 hypothetical protein [Achromobacter sp. ACM01]